MIEVATAVILKSKAYLIAALVGFASSTVRYVEHKRKLRDGTLNKNVPIIRLYDWFLFGCMASVITMTGVGVIEWLGYEFNKPMMVLIFWMGLMTDHLFQWIPMLIKKKLDNVLNNKND